MMGMAVQKWVMGYCEHLYSPCDFCAYQILYGYMQYFFVEIPAIMIILYQIKPQGNNPSDAETILSLSNDGIAQ